MGPARASHARTGADHDRERASPDGTWPLPHGARCGDARLARRETGMAGRTSAASPYAAAARAAQDLRVMIERVAEAREGW